MQSPGGDLVNVVSQSGLIKFIEENKEAFPILKQSIKDLAVGSMGKVMSVVLTDSYWYAFRVMSEKVCC